MSCKHLDEFVLDAAGIEAYKAVHANLISPWTPAGLERKSRASICMFNAGSTSKNSSCSGRSASRLHACLHCIHVACISSNSGYHSRSHSNQALNHRDVHSRENEHPLSVELNHGNVYCSGKSVHIYICIQSTYYLWPHYLILAYWFFFHRCYLQWLCVSSGPGRNFRKTLSPFIKAFIN